MTCEGRGQGVFCTLESGALQELNEVKNANTYKKGQNLFLEGNPPFGLFCVNSGKIKITKSNASGKETIVRIASQGDLLGHRSLFSKSPYEASATIIEDAKICFISKEAIHKLIKENPSLSFEIINHLSQQMGAAENRLASLAQKSVREKFAELLLLLSQSYGIESENGQVELDIKLTREEMASMIGVASENLIRLVTEFKQENIIKQEGKTIYLLDVSKIETYANLN